MEKKEVIVRDTVFGPFEEWDGIANYKAMLFEGPPNENGIATAGDYLAFKQEKAAIDAADSIGVFMNLMEIEDCALDDPDELEFMAGKKIKKDETGNKIKKQSTLDWDIPKLCTNGDYLVTAGAGGARGQIPGSFIAGFIPQLDYLCPIALQSQFVIV